MDDSKWELKDITQGCSTKEQTKNVLRALARVHGSHWGLNIPELYPWMHPLNLPAMTAHTIGGVSAGLPSALPNLEKVLSSELYKLVESFSTDEISKYMDECCEDNFVLLHNDVKVFTILILVIIILLIFNVDGKYVSRKRW